MRGDANVKIATLAGRLGAVNGLTALNKGPGLKQTRMQRQAEQQLQMIWLGLAMHVISWTPSPAPVILGITSAIGGEGKTTSCLGLGSALANETEQTVLLMDCDLAEPCLARRLDVSTRPGLVEHLAGGASIEDIVRRTNVDNLHVAVAGGEERDDVDGQIQNQAALRRLKRQLPNILASLKEHYDYIIIDMPPVLTNPYTRELVSCTEGTFLAVKAGVTPLASIPRVAQDVGNGRFRGVILTGATSPLPDWLLHLLSE